MESLASRFKGRTRRQLGGLSFRWRTARSQCFECAAPSVAAYQWGRSKRGAEEFTELRPVGRKVPSTFAPSAGTCQVGTLMSCCWHSLLLLLSASLRQAALDTDDYNVPRHLGMCQCGNGSRYAYSLGSLVKQRDIDAWRQLHRSQDMYLPIVSKTAPYRSRSSFQVSIRLSDIQVVPDCALLRLHYNLLKRSNGSRACITAMAKISRENQNHVHFYKHYSGPGAASPGKKTRCDFVVLKNSKTPISRTCPFCKPYAAMLNNTRRREKRALQFYRSKML